MAAIKGSFFKICRVSKISSKILHFLIFQIFGLCYLEKSSTFHLMLGLIHRVALTILYVASTVFAIYKNAVVNSDLTIVSKIGTISFISSWIVTQIPAVY